MEPAKSIIVLTRILPKRADGAPADDTLALNAEERQRSRYRCFTHAGQGVLLCLPRGTRLVAGQRLTTEAQDWTILIQAKAEPLYRVEAETPLQLMKAAYHLGNRHVSLELTADCLWLTPDPVLKEMLTQLHCRVTEAIAPFHPEVGAYHAIHSHP